jgi:hypothetical protein
MTPFEQWFSSDWNKALHSVPVDTSVLSSGQSIHTASWDRRAAYLVWDALGRPNAAWVEQMRSVYEKKSDDLLDLLDEPSATAVAPVQSHADDLEDLLG